MGVHDVDNQCFAHVASEIALKMSISSILAVSTSFVGTPTASPVIHVPITMRFIMRLAPLKSCNLMKVCSFFGEHCDSRNGLSSLSSCSSDSSVLVLVGSSWRVIRVTGMPNDEELGN